MTRPTQHYASPVDQFAAQLAEIANRLDRLERIVGALARRVTALEP